MTIPGVGPVSLWLCQHDRHTGTLQKFQSRWSCVRTDNVLNQSGEGNRVGRVSLCGDTMMRTLLYEEAQVTLTVVRKWSWLKAWAMNIAKRRGHLKAIVALARRLAVIMHGLWSDGTEFQWSKDHGLAEA